MVDAQITSSNTQHYLRHLTELNDTQPVSASEDIYNQFGVLLIAKGSRINAQVQKQLLQHRLKKSIDDQVVLENTLSDLELFQQLLGMIEDSVEYAQMHRGTGFEDLFRHICLTARLPLQIRQKLTVMSQRLPLIFAHCQFTGWASALIAHEMKLSIQTCQNAYICGLLHDVGFLHLPIEVQTQTPLSDEHWRALQSHVLIGQRCADSCGLHKEIGVGILEHHERLDQTGYPTRKSPEKLSLLGQIVASADLLHHLCTHELDHTTASLAGALPHFKIHHGSFNGRIHSALMRILHQATLDQADKPTPLKPVNLERVRSINSQLQTLLAPLAKLRQHAELASAPKGPKVLAIMMSINTLMANSGIDDQQLNDWLLSDIDPADADNTSCLTELDAMQYELLWLIKRLGWNLSDFLSDAASESQQSQSEPFSRYQEQLTSSLNQAFELYR
mgnify:CR=1 FL=1